MRSIILLFYSFPHETIEVRGILASIEKSPREWLKMEAATIRSCVGPDHDIAWLPPAPTAE